MKTTIYEANKELVDSLQALELVSEYLPVSEFVEEIHEIINIHMILENYQLDMPDNKSLRSDLSFELNLLSSRLTETMDNNPMDILTLYTCGLALKLLENESSINKYFNSLSGVKTLSRSSVLLAYTRCSR